MRSTPAANTHTRTHVYTHTQFKSYLEHAEHAYCNHTHTHTHIHTRTDTHADIHTLNLVRNMQRIPAVKTHTHTYIHTHTHIQFFF